VEADLGDFKAPSTCKPSATATDGETKGEDGETTGEAMRKAM